MVGVSEAKTVVVVDDDVDILDSIAVLLELSIPGVRVVGTVSPTEALEQAKAGATLLVTDFRMPQMDGLELARQAREIDPGLPIFLATAYPDPDIGARARAMGIEIVSKPMNPDLLIARVAGILAH